MTKQKDPLKPSAGDYLHSIVKAGLSSVPYGGSAAAELFALVIAPPLEKRRKKWMDDVAERLKRLEVDKRVDLAELQNNDLFIDVVLKTTQFALRNSQKEKLEYLKNALLNVATGKYSDEDTVHSFLNLVDNFSAWHIRILRLYDDPVRWFQEQGKVAPDFYTAGLEAVMETAYPDLRGKREVYDIIWRELSQNGLLGGASLHAMMTGQGLLQRKTTELGRQFLEFIAESGV
jgi:hypothetical protein